jgi:predicted O-linked N-acetylglucosamine transferase (SPINDLY family)
MEILKSRPKSILFLIVSNDIAQDNIFKMVSDYGVEQSRVLVKKRLGSNEYLSALSACDLFLDTFPYNAGTTASDALWLGLPVITLQGRSFASRICSSVLHSLGLDDLIVYSLDAYIEKSLFLASQPQSLKDIREKIRINKLTYPLFKTESFVKNIEKAFVKINSFNTSALKNIVIH